MRSVEAFASGAGHAFSTDCQSSVSFPWWLPVITTLFTLKQHLCWLSVVVIISMMTFSHQITNNNIKQQQTTSNIIKHHQTTTNAIGESHVSSQSVQWLAVTTFMLTGSHRAPRSRTNKSFAPGERLRSWVLECPHGHSAAAFRWCCTWSICRMWEGDLCVITASSIHTEVTGF